MTKFALLLFTLFITSHASIAQDGQLNEASYDFWLGKWEANWVNADGSTGSGTNHIFKVLDGKVLEENFKITTGKQAGFLGMSISVFNPNKKEWHQAWADNQGGYIDLIGEIEDDKKVFKTKPLTNGDKVIMQRMVFYNIKKDKFTWDWEGTQDGGKSWNLQWRINYSRQK